MSTDSVRVRFAPSPTGGLHIGGVRTILFNYWFARRQGGKFILRIEDTDRSRFVPGAEQYIFDCLAWCGIHPDESVLHGGEYGPYKQSERKALYQQYAEQLIKSGHAYYAFDTAEELERMREQYKTAENPAPQYNHRLRMQMRNSLSLSAAETQQLLDAGTPYVIRINVPEKETVHFQDMIRGEIHHDTGTLDDKVLMKADGMPTYHLAVVVDDYLMRISHVFRGEEWLPSAPIHILLWRYLGWEAEMPTWAHLPLILKPDGHGKLSKRDGQRLGFPVYALNWKNPDGEVTEGFKEAGFLPEAFINFLALLGWNPGTEQELFTPGELEESFSIERVHKGGAKFDYEKAKWFNQQHIQRCETDRLATLVAPYMEAAGLAFNIEKLKTAVDMVKERCQLLTDFVEQAGFLFNAPEQPDFSPIQAKWNAEKTRFFTSWMAHETFGGADPESWESGFNQLLESAGLKKGEVMMPLRLMLVGGKFGPGVFDIAAFIGADEVRKRIETALGKLEQQG